MGDKSLIDSTLTAQRTAYNQLGKSSSSEREFEQVIDQDNYGKLEQNNLKSSVIEGYSRETIGSLVSQGDGGELIYSDAASADTSR